VYAPAELTWRRGALVNNTHLARLAAAAGLQAHVSAHSRALRGAMHRFAAAQQQQKPGDGGNGTGQQVGFAAPQAAAAPAAAVADGSRLGGLSRWTASDIAVWERVWRAPHGRDGDDSGGGDGASHAAGVVARAQRAPKVLADVVEALVAAVLVDSSSSSSSSSRSSSSSSSSSGQEQSLNWGATWAVLQRLMPSLAQR
jgi:dsRNA-specific ribonuclease